MDELKTPTAKNGLRRLWNAFNYSLQGLVAAFKGEAAFRQEAILAMILIPAALLLQLEGYKKALLIGSVLLVMLAELLNSAIEAVVDRVSEERHPLSKRAKDMGSAAVLLALANAVLTWLLVLFG